MATEFGLTGHAQTVFPLQCTVCLAPAGHCHDITVTVVSPVVITRDGVSRVAGQRTEHRAFSIPYCERHLPQAMGIKRRLRNARRLRTVLSLLLSLTAGAAAALVRGVGWPPGADQLLQSGPVVAGAFVLTLAVTFPLLLLPVMRLAGILGACRAMYHARGVSLAVTAFPGRQLARWRRREPMPDVVLRFGSHRYAELFRRRNVGLLEC